MSVLFMLVVDEGSKEAMIYNFVRNTIGSYDQEVSTAALIHIGLQ